MLIYPILYYALISQHLYVHAIQSNSSCALEPKDKRQLVCQCSKKLHLLCVFNIDIKEISAKDLDRSLAPVYYEDVALSRNSVDPENHNDINKNFAENLRKFKNKIYLYFPNFNVLNAAFNRIYFVNFIFIPSFAFYEKALFLQEYQKSKDEEIVYETVPNKLISTVVFELPEIYDFGIDRFAFYGLKTEMLILEGPFDQINVHKEAFFNADIEELNIGCYCLECEKLVRNCHVNFNQNSGQETFSFEQKYLSDPMSNIASIKLYGIQLGDGIGSIKWNLDDLPAIAKLKRLEIINSVINNNNNDNNNNNNNNNGEYEPFQNDIELMSGKNNSYENLYEFIFRNNGMRIIKNNILQIFPKLGRLDLSQNEIEKIESNAFSLSVNNNLTELYLERNKIKTLDKFLFDSLGKLKLLNIKENQLDYLDDFTFKSLVKLESLDLSRNKLTTLTEQTFSGLFNLQELFLSYNPLKNIDTNTFKFLSIHSPLNRLEIISNTDTDWFVFDDTDICLLANFKCGTKIHIDYEQNCNCFIKYSNLIGEESIEVSANSDSAWFKPCSIEYKQMSKQKNRYAHEEFERDEEIQRIIHKSECSKNSLQKCYSKQIERELDSEGNDDHLFNKSCLFNRLLSAHQSQVSTLPIEITTSMKPSTTTKKALLDLSVDSKEPLLKKNDESNSLNDNSVELKLKYILTGIGVLSLVSITSLLIAFYLLFKSKRIQYHLADSDISKK